MFHRSNSLGATDATVQQWGGPTVWSIHFNQSDNSPLPPPTHNINQVLAQWYKTRTALIATKFSPPPKKKQSHKYGEIAKSENNSLTMG